MTVSKSPGLMLAILAVAGLALAGCDENEQGRILRYEKGTYLGKPDQPVDEQTLDDLRQRARLQAGG